MNVPPKAPLVINRILFFGVNQCFDRNPERLPGMHSLLVDFWENMGVRKIWERRIWKYRIVTAVSRASHSAASSCLMTLKIV